MIKQVSAWLVLSDRNGVPHYIGAGYIPAEDADFYMKKQVPHHQIGKEFVLLDEEDKEIDVGVTLYVKDVLIKVVWEGFDVWLDTCASQEWK